MIFHDQFHRRKLVGIEQIGHQAMHFVRASMPRRFAAPCEGGWWFNLTLIGAAIYENIDRYCG